VDLVPRHTRNSHNNNSILYYLCAKSTATRPITDTAQCRYKSSVGTTTIIMGLNENEKNKHNNTIIKK
jgi:hypothetical protein